MEPSHSEFFGWADGILYFISDPNFDPALKIMMSSQP
jgi:hypothetical protein